MKLKFFLMALWCLVFMGQLTAQSSCDNRALDFDGINDHVTTPTPLTGSLMNNFTVACWFRDDRQAGVNDDFFYRLFGWTATDRFELGDRNGNLELFTNSTGSLTGPFIRDGLWHHVAVVRTATDVTVYLDGTQVITTPLALFTNLGTVFRIGDWAGGGNIDRFWRGRVDEFKIWGATPTASQIQAEMNCGIDPANNNLLIYFPFDQNIPGGNNAGMVAVTDEGPGGGVTNGMLSGFALNGNTSNWVDRGRDRLPPCDPNVMDPCFGVCKVNNICLDLDGIDDHVTTPNPLTGSLTNNFTVACWFRDDRPAGVNDGLFYRLFGWTSTDRFELGDRNGNLELFTTGSLTGPFIRDGLWHHVAVVRTTTDVTVYLDGTQVITTPLALFTNLGTVFRIGDWAGGGNIARFWRGRVDEFKIWGTALTLAQVQAEMECGADPSNNNLLIYFPFDQNIPGGNNAGMVAVTDEGPGGGVTNGMLSGFALNGNTSNWVARGRDLLPVCNVSAFDWLEGDRMDNRAGRTKVFDSHLFTAGTHKLQPGGPDFPVFTRRRPDGSIVWRTRLNIPGYINDFIYTDEGCYLLVGHSPSFTGDNRSFIARIAENGVLNWLHTYNIQEREAFNRIIRSSNPSNPNFPYTVCGIAKPAGTSTDDILLFTLNNAGSIGWMRRIGTTSSDDEFRMDLLDVNGTYVLTGLRIGAGGLRGVLFKTDYAGVQLTSSGEYNNVFSIQTAAQTGSDLLVAGQLPGGNGAYIARLNGAGVQVWARKFPDIDNFTRVVVRPGGQVYALGFRRPGAPYRNIIVKVLDTPNGGMVQWMKRSDLSDDSAWVGADLVHYSGDMFFYTDGRTKNPGAGFGNYDIAAVMDRIDLLPCPYSTDSLHHESFTMPFAALPTLSNALIAPPVPVITNPWSPVSYEGIRLCNNPCTCRFENLGFSRKVVAGIPIIPGNWPVTCDTVPVNLPCPAQLSPILFRGRLTCNGDNCEFTGLSWEIRDPNNNMIASGTSPTSQFSIPITLAMVQTPGVYSIHLSGSCGGMTECSCIVRFRIPECPRPCDCNEPAFTQDVHQAFNRVQSSGCKFTFTPKALTPCDAVQWRVAKSSDLIFTVFANSAGNNSVMYTFPASEQYVVCYTVTRTVPGIGTVCSASRCVLLDVNCSLLFQNDDNAIQLRSQSCAGSIVQNGGFTEGAEAGSFNDGGSIANWERSAGDPTVVLEQGAQDPNFVRLHGNSGFADVLYQNEVNVPMHSNIDFVTAYRPLPGLIRPGTQLVARISTEQQDSIFCSDNTNCRELFRIDIPQNAPHEWFVVGTYDSIPFTGRYVTLHVENPFADDDPGLQSAVEIDNVCLRQFQFVNVKTTGPVARLQIWPNPTSGEINIQLPVWEGRTDARVLVSDLTGRIVTEKRTTGTDTIETIQLGKLPAGIYLVQIQEASGRVVAVERIIKQ
jgi:hypothetical protein